MRNREKKGIIFLRGAPIRGQVKRLRKEWDGNGAANHAGKKTLGLSRYKRIVSD
jgi:hypothetical protein